MEALEQRLLLFRPYTHFTAGMDVLTDVLADRMVAVHGQDYPVNPQVANALRDFPQFYNAGVTADALPDLAMNQAVLHPESTGLWLRHVYERAWAAQTDPSYTAAERSQILAWSYGFLTHAAGDVWSHTLVNEFAEGVFPGLGEILTDVNKAAIAARHIIVEGHIADATPGYDGNPNRTPLANGDISDDSTPGIPMDVPHRFIYETLVRPDGGQPSSHRGPILDGFIELRNKLSRARQAGPILVDNLGTELLAYQDTSENLASLRTDCDFQNLSDAIACPVAVLNLFGTVIADSVDAFSNFVSSTTEAIVARVTNAFLDEWIADIDDGLEHWSELGLQSSKALFDAQARRDVQNEECGNSLPTCEDDVSIIDVLMNQVDDPEEGFINQHLLRMLGVPDIAADLRSLLGGIQESLEDLLNETLESLVIVNPLRDTVDQIKKHARDLVLETVFEGFGVDYEQIENFSDSPSARMDLQSISFDLDPRDPDNPSVTLPLFDPNDHAKLDGYMGLPNNHHTLANGGFGDNVTFNRTAFAAYDNTVTLSKLLLLDGATLDKLIGDLTGSEFVLYGVAEPSIPAGGNIMITPLPGVGPTKQWLVSMDADHAWREDSQPLFTDPGGQPFFSDNAPPSGGAGNFPLWESCELRDPVFRELFRDWQNGVVTDQNRHNANTNFPDAGDDCLPPSIVIRPDGPEQLPLVYVHGFNDSGALWGTQGGPYWAALRDRVGDPDSSPVTSYAVQFWSDTADVPVLEDGNPSATADEGRAMLQTPEFVGLEACRALPGPINAPNCNPYNGPPPRPFTTYRNNYNRDGHVDAHAEDLVDMYEEQFAPGQAFQDLRQVNMITHSAGGLDTRAMLHKLNQSDDPTDQERIANVIYTAPPFGGSFLAELDSLMWPTQTLPTPPNEFGQITDAFFNSPWIRFILNEKQQAAIQALQVFQPLVAIVQSILTWGVATASQIPFVPEVTQLIVNAAVALGISPQVIQATWDQLANQANQALRAGAVQFLRTARLFIENNDLIPGFREVIAPRLGQLDVLGGIQPGLPKSRDDLRPFEAVQKFLCTDRVNFPCYEENENTRQFVTWGEANFHLSGSALVFNPVPSLAVAASDPRSLYAFGDLNRNGTNFSNSQFLADDCCVANVSARILAKSTDNPDGYMTELTPTPERRGTSGGYRGLVHGEMINKVDVVGREWVQALMTPVTSLVVTEPVLAADDVDRLYRVGAHATFRFRAEARTFVDQFSHEITVTPSLVQYRVVAHTAGGVSQYSDWIDVRDPDNFVAEFSTLVQPYGVGRERLFDLEWRSINQLGGQEAIRSAQFQIDDQPPSVRAITLTDLFNPDDTSEIAHRSLTQRDSIARRSNLILSAYTNPLTGQFTHPYLDRILGRLETDWVIRQTNKAKLLLITFDGPGKVFLKWDDPTLANPGMQQTTQAVGLFLASNVVDPTTGVTLTPGPHTLYYRAEDAAGNSTVVQSISVLVDDQPPVTAINQQANFTLGIAIGPDTPLYFSAQDAELAGVTGGIFGPGLPASGLPVNTTFTLRNTNLAEIAAAQGSTARLVDLVAHATDRVGNSSNQTFQIYYDFTSPVIEIASVGNSLRLADGSYRTTQREVSVELRMTENDMCCGAPAWVSVQRGTLIVQSGPPFALTASGRYAGNIILADGSNEILFTSTDLVGNTGTLRLTIEKADQLLPTGIDTRPIELVSKPVLKSDSFFPQNVSNVAVSDDGSVYLFESDRSNLVSGDTNGLKDIFMWRDGTVTRINVGATREQVVAGQSRSPSISGNGRYGYFASAAANLVTERTQGVNLYVEDLETGQVALVSRSFAGNPADLPVSFGSSFSRTSATYDGRYVFFEDRYAGYVPGDTNQTSDIFVADLDPDLDGDYFDNNYVIRRVSLGSGSAQGMGGNPTNGGAHRPAISANGQILVYDTDHTNVFPNDTNGQRDAVVVRFKGVDAQGTIDFSAFTVAPIALSTTASDHANINREGTLATFVTAGMLAAQDLNPSTDVYIAILSDNLQQNLVVYNGPLNSTATMHPTGSIRPGAVSPITIAGANFPGRTAFVAHMLGLSAVDRAGAPNETNDIDLFVRPSDSATFEQINWLAPNIPPSVRPFAFGAVLEGGITGDGRWAWWVMVPTGQEYPGFNPSDFGTLLYRRRVDSDVAGLAVRPISSGLTTEQGGTASFTVNMRSQPRDVVTVQVTSNDAAEGVPTPATLTFTPVNWNVPQTVTVTGQNDAVPDGPAEYAVRLATSSRDSLYNGIAPEVDLVNADDEPAAVAPVITAQPVSLVAGLGDPVLFSVTASGTPRLSYQWFRDGVPLAGQTNSTLNILSTQPSDAGSFTVQVSNDGGSIVTRPATLTVTSGIGQDIHVHHFTTVVRAPDRLEIRYQITGSNVPQFSFAFFGSADARFDRLDTERGQRLAVTSASDRTLGVHTIQFDGAGYAQFLNDPAVPFFIVVADATVAVQETNETNNDASFIGLYRSVANPSPLIIRGRDGSDRYGGSPDDTMSVSMGTTLSASANFGQEPLAIPATNVSEVRVFGHEGNDTLIVQQITVAVVGSVTNSSIAGLGKTVTHSGLESIQVLLGPSNDSMNANLSSIPVRLVGGDGNDRLIGGMGNDTLDGGAGADSLSGGDGNDMLSGGLGNDTMSGDLGDDMLRGGPDTDRVSESGDINFTLSDTGLIGQGTDVLTGVEQMSLQGGASNNKIDAIAFTGSTTLDGSRGDDTIIGGSGDDVILGGTGNDSLTGGAGNDTYVFSADAALGSDTLNEAGGGTDTLDFSATTTLAVVVNLSVATAQTVNANLTLTLSSATTFENVIGGSLGDTFTGNSLSNALTGGPGNDTYVFDADAALGSDTLNETGGGVDTLDFSLTTTKSIVVNLSVATSQAVNSNLSLVLSSGSVFENVAGGSLGDTITGNTLHNTLRGGPGNDTLSGGDGNDSLFGDAGDDSLVGGIGTDTALGGADCDRADVTTEIVQLGGQACDGIVFRGTSGNDQVRVGFDFIPRPGFEGCSLEDALGGRCPHREIVLWELNGKTTRVEYDAGGTIIVFAGKGNDRVETEFAVGAHWHMELHGERGNDTLIGGVKSDLLIGGDGNDRLEGLGGDDELRGGDGNDRLFGGDGNDLLRGGRGNDHLDGQDGDAVSLRLTSGGLVRLTRQPDGEGQDLAVGLLGTVTTATSLSGTVKPPKTGGTGRCTTLRSVTGLRPGTSKLPPCNSTTPGFQIGNISATIVDRLLESEHLVGRF